MNVLVTGASGTIGSLLVPRLLQEGWQVYCQSRSDRTPQGDETWLRFELSDSSSALSRLSEVNLVFHLASQTSIGAARDDPIAALRDNVEGPVNLFEALRALSTQPFVVATGTVTQVGLPDTTTITESVCDRPITFYDVTKHSTELFLMQYVREGWLGGCCLRLATVYGASGGAQAADRGIIDRLYRRALEGDDLQVFGDGEALRDYVHVEDVVEALLAAATNREATNGRTFLIGTGRGTSLKEAFSSVARLAASKTGRDVAVTHVDPPSGLSPIDMRSAVIDPTAFREATGWVPRYDLESGLARSYASKDE